MKRSKRGLDQAVQPIVPHFSLFAHSIKESLGLSAGKDTITTFLILSDSGPCGPAVAWRAGQNRFFKVLYAGPATAYFSLSL